jgi:hypothetical protein
LSTPTPEETACKDGSAQILVGDGFLKAVCGCQGAGESGKIYTVSTPLTCHLQDSNSTVFFQLWGAKQPHQFVPTSSTDSHVSTPILNPNSLPALSSTGITFSRGGKSYDYLEIYSGYQLQFVIP